MSRIITRNTFVRLAALGFLVLSSLGPWFADAHPATEATCTAPLVWLGGGHCACLIPLIETYRHVSAGSGFTWWLGLPPLLPVLFTLLLLLSRNQRLLWYFHLAGWVLIAIYALFWFIIGLSWLFESWPSNKYLFLWGAGLCSVVAVTLLLWEIRTAKHRPKQNLVQAV